MIPPEVSLNNFVSHYYERLNVISSSPKNYDCGKLENKTKVFCHFAIIS